MESSPLAAMQPPPLPPAWGCGRQFLSSRARHSGPELLGTGSFNFKDMSMMRSQSDYFSNKHARGSSPAASLAADLSQNFHIDQSPQLPTPRRSLFTSSNLFQMSTAREGATTPPIRWEGVTTPPIPSSSPGYGHDAMDMSPLPHKPPFARAIESLPPPAPVMTLDEAMSSPPAMTSDTTDSQESHGSGSSTFERRKPLLARPSLTRSSKFFSTNSVVQEARGPNNQLPPFKFGAGVESQVVKSLSLDDVEDSPKPQRSSFESVTTLMPPRPRQLFPSNSFTNRINGSPVGPLAKKVPCPLQRPRKQFRRSNSMFEHPADIMKQDKKEFSSCGLQSIMDVDDTHKQALPHHFPADSRDGLPRISQETMLDVLDGKYQEQFDQVVVVDCRFEYEFQGGHVDGAINRNDKKQLAAELFSRETPGNTLLVLHCEFSVHRAPLMAEHIRREDRRKNEENYPRLSYPEVYILEGGYHSFFENHSGRCYPQAYTQMNAAGHEDTCEREMDKIRQRGKLSRAKTYAFGQGLCTIQDSPTGVQRSHSSFNAASTQAYNRRMASY